MNVFHFVDLDMGMATMKCPANEKHFLLVSVMISSSDIKMK